MKDCRELNMDLVFASIDLPRDDDHLAIAIEAASRNTSLNVLFMLVRGHGSGGWSVHPDDVLRPGGGIRPVAAVSLKRA